MEIQYYKFFSSALGRDMEFKSYGHAGRPVLFIPSENGHFFDFETFRMIDTWVPWIDSGQVMVFSIDTVDRETWSYKSGNPYWRIRRHEEWMNYIVQELVPFIHSVVNRCNGWTGSPGIIAFGCSLGATHAVNLYFRYPELFDGLLALSGIYTADEGFDGYMDSIVYLNSPLHYLPNMALDHPYIKQYNRNRGIICVGQGMWEKPEYTRELERILKEKGINVKFDYWGYDANHDWSWWFKQVEYFLPILLSDDELPDFPLS